jgi:predicted flap endonuclease-1-like 5' DNA nuclease
VLAVSTRAADALRTESAAQSQALGEAQGDRDRASDRAEAAIAARRIADERVSELEAQMAELGELRREARIFSEQRTSLTARLEQLTLHSQRLESERTRAVLMAESLERQLKQVAESGQTSRSLQATELLDLKRQHEVASTQIEQLRQDQAAAVSERDELKRRMAQTDHDRRTAAVAHQEALAALQAQLGGVHALAERAEPLRRQLEDREGLIRSVAEERDEAIRAVIRQERESVAVKAELERELGRLRGLESDLATQTQRAATAESQLASAGRDRDEYAAAARTARVEIESLKAEIKDRDLRFRTLLDDRRYFVEQSQDQIARLREDMTRSRLAGGDDLKRITGIGPHLEGKLKQLGVTTFRQIAEWSETDIEQISKELGPFAHRIRRDRWIEQAQRAGKLEGEPAA